VKSYAKIAIDPKVISFTNKKAETTALSPPRCHRLTTTPTAIKKKKERHQNGDIQIKTGSQMFQTTACCAQSYCNPLGRVPRPKAN